MDNIAWSERYALEYGPILLAVANSDEARLHASGPTVQSFTDQLKAAPDQPLCFTIEGNPDHRYVPYFAIKEETFTCFPIIENGPNGSIQGG
jgi:hypothetical protein